jgi:hypothetical protein
MPELAYTVYTTFTEARLADEWLRWLRDGGHIAEVMAGGATDAEIIELDPPAGAQAGARAFEVRYHFPSREHFARYEREHAPRLRAEGVKLFPVERGVSYRRAVGIVVTRNAK